MYFTIIWKEWSILNGFKSILFFNLLTWIQNNDEHKLKKKRNQEMFRWWELCEYLFLHKNALSWRPSKSIIHACNHLMPIHGQMMFWLRSCPFIEKYVTYNFTLFIQFKKLLKAYNFVLRITRLLFYNST